MRFGSLLLALAGAASASFPKSAMAFSYFEHKYVGQVACKVLERRGGLPKDTSCVFQNEDGQSRVQDPLVFGDLVALSGDHYDSDALRADFEEILQRRRDVLGFLQGPSEKLQLIRAVADAELVEAEQWYRFSISSSGFPESADISAVSAAFDAVPSCSQASEACDLGALVAALAEANGSGIHLLPINDGRSGPGETASLEEATGVVVTALTKEKRAGVRCFTPTGGLLESFNSLPDYLGLAFSNQDHFGAEALASYRQKHQDAQRIAAQSALRAHLIEGAALHFLTDLFAAGHIRTPRGELQSTEAKSRHDWDNRHGLIVRAFFRHKTAARTRGNTAAAWVSYGDGCLFGDETGANRRMAILVTAYSLMSVHHGVQKTLPFTRPVAVFGLNAPPVVGARHHINLGIGVGVTIQPTTSTTLDGERRSVDLRSYGALTIGYVTPLKPLLLEGRISVLQNESRFSPIWPGAEFGWGDWGVRTIFLQPALRLSAVDGFAGVSLDSRGEIVWVVYPPGELRFSVGFTVPDCCRGWHDRDGEFHAGVSWSYSLPAL